MIEPGREQLPGRVGRMQPDDESERASGDWLVPRSPRISRDPVSCFGTKVRRPTFPYVVFLGPCGHSRRSCRRVCPHKIDPTASAPVLTLVCLHLHRIELILVEQSTTATKSPRGRDQSGIPPFRHDPSVPVRRRQKGGAQQLGRRGAWRARSPEPHCQTRAYPPVHANSQLTAPRTSRPRPRQKAPNATSFA